MKLLVTWVVAVLLGVAVSAALCRSNSFRDLLGRASGRGHLQAIASGTGIYEADLSDEVGALQTAVVAQNLRSRSSDVPVDATKLQGEWDVLRKQFGSEKVFAEAMRGSGLSERSLRNVLAERLRAESYLEQRLAVDSTPPADDALATFYASHREYFGQPTRFRAAHVFFAAPTGAEPEIVKAKEQAIHGASDRLAHGADFAQLAAELSEDEATKTRGGDLGYFGEARMPPEFIEAVSKLQPGETSQPLRSHLGFHLVRMLEMKPAHDLSIAEAREETTADLGDENRRRKIDALATELAAARYIRSQR